MPAQPTRVQSVIAPMTQLNTPVPSSACLIGVLRSRGVAAVQEDLALALIPERLPPAGPRAVRECIAALPANQRTPRALARGSKL